MPSWRRQGRKKYFLRNRHTWVVLQFVFILIYQTLFILTYQSLFNISCNFLFEGFSAQFMIRYQCNFASCLLHRLTKSLIAVDCQGHATTCSETARKSLSLPLKTFKPDIIRILCFIFSFHSQNFRFIEFIELYCIELI